MVAHNRRSAKSHSGIWRDLAIRKRKTEADAQILPIVEFGRKAWRGDAADRADRCDDPRDRRRQAAAGARKPRRAGSVDFAGGCKMNIGFDSRVVIVTGAAHGFGRAIAKPSPTVRAIVHVCDVNEEGLARDAGAMRRSLPLASSSMSATATRCRPRSPRSRPRAPGHRHPGQQRRRRARPGRPAARRDLAGATGRRSSTSICPARSS